MGASLAEVPDWGFGCGRGFESQALSTAGTGCVQYTACNRPTAMCHAGWLWFGGLFWSTLFGVDGFGALWDVFISLPQGMDSTTDLLSLAPCGPSLLVRSGRAAAAVVALQQQGAAHVFWLGLVCLGYTLVIARGLAGILVVTFLVSHLWFQDSAAL
jgi:hypothetical protein